jgi:acid phosphatase
MAMRGGALHWIRILILVSVSLGGYVLWSQRAFAQTPGFSHVFVVMEENHGYSQVVGNSAMPYLSMLINNYGLATQYYANSHPSLPNYLWITSGSNDGITTDECESSSGPLDVDNAVRELNAAGVSWRAYMEDLPSVGWMGCKSGEYRQKHDPFAYYSDVANNTDQQQHIVPFSQFDTDLAADNFAGYNFVTPDLCDDLHSDPSCSNGCTSNSSSACFTGADNWLKTNIGPLLNTNMFQPGGDGVLIIVFDEGSANVNGGGQVAWVIVGPQVKGYRSTNFYQHQSTLRLMLQGLGVTKFPQAAATAAEMSEFFKPISSATATATPAPSSTPSPRPTASSTPTPQPTASPEPPSRSGTINGIYDLGKTDSSAFASSVLANPSVDGLAIRASWSTVEPSDGTYDWSNIDNAIAMARASGKKVSISIAAGIRTPSWLYAEGAKHFSFVWDKAWGPTYCSVVEVPLPWDTTFQKKWAEFVAAFGARYDRNAIVAFVKLTGLNSKTEEVSLPHSIDESINHGQCTGYNDVANWQAAGYTRLEVEAAWQQIMTDFNQAFPDKQFAAMFVASPGSLPPIDDNGNIITGSNCDGQGNTDLINYAIANYGRSRFIGQNNGLSANWIWLTLVSDSAYIDTSYQELAPQKSYFPTAATKAIDGHAKFLEVYEPDLTNTSLQSAITTAHSGLLGN